MKILDRVHVPGRPHRHGRLRDPAEAIFGAIRLRLTLWYGLALLLALVLSSTLLYVGIQRTLIGPVDQNLRVQAQNLAVRWQEYPLPCPRDPNFDSALIACYDPAGTLVVASPYARLAAGFTDPALAVQAIKGGLATDTTNTGDYGDVRRFALRVTNAQGAILGILVVGFPIGGEVKALETLLKLLLILGGSTLLFSLLVGLLLAQRALRPARDGYVRQRAFVSDAAHELRTPLTLLRADAEVLLRGRRRLDPEDVELVEDMVREVGHMATLADTMLNLARLDAGERPPEQDVVDLAVLGREVASRITALAAERQVTVRCEAPESVLVLGDRTWLEQATLILADNAIKYNRPGGAVTLRVGTEEDRARLEVSDTGIGVAAGDLPHLGERFFRVDKARTRAQGGAGLGLSIARAIAQRHGGRLSHASRLDEGTTAILTLPLLRARLPRSSETSYSSLT